MSNMSYCRFRNTQMDVEDCMEALSNLNWQESDEYDEEEMNYSKLDIDEARAASRMMFNFLETMLEIGLIEDYDYDGIEKFVKRITK